MTRRSPAETGLVNTSPTSERTPQGTSERPQRHADTAPPDYLRRGHDPGESPRYRTQKIRIAALLCAQDSVCGTQLLDEHMPRYAVGIYRLRRDGWRIQTRQCRNPEHQHRTPQIEYVLEALPSSVGAP